MIAAVTCFSFSFSLSSDGERERLAVQTSLMISRKEIRYLVLAFHCRGNQWPLDDVPHILGSVTELTARDTSAEAVVADADRLVFDGVRKVVSPFRHGPNEDADAFSRAQAFDVVSDSHNLGVEAERHLPTIGWQIVGDGVLDDFEKLFLRVCGADGEAVKKLNHQACKSLEGSRYADGRANLDEDAFGGVDVDLKFPSFVDRRIEKSEKALHR